MVNGICTLGVIPLRAEPASKSEMISQLLFGERYCVLQEMEEWIKVQTILDKYEGWISKNQFSILDNSSVAYEVVPAFPYMNATETKSGKEHRIPCGSLVYEPVWNNEILHFRCGKFDFSCSKSDFFMNSVGSDLVVSAMRFLNSPYLWGGRTFMGIDCSGYTQLLYRLAGKSIDRDAWQQALQGNVVDFLEEALPGDLAFFDNSEGKITHVGMVLGNGEIIHASGCVRIDALDHNGIYRREDSNYTHKLRVVKRYP